MTRKANKCVRNWVYFLGRGGVGLLLISANFGLIFFPFFYRNFPGLYFRVDDPTTLLLCSILRI